MLRIGFVILSYHLLATVTRLGYYVESESSSIQGLPRI